MCRRIEQGLLVSCQAPDGGPLAGPDPMARFAAAAVAGGAVGIRANGPADVRAIRHVVGVPIIGLHKEVQEDGRILITPSFDYAQGLVEAGADIVAVDCTERGQQFGAFERLQRIRAELEVPVMADIATVEEAIQAAAAGADLVATTMRGYTDATRHLTGFEPAFVAKLVRAVEVPVVAEGRIHHPDQARAAMAAGAFAVIVGTAITAPRWITNQFVRAVVQGRQREVRHFLGIDLGGTNTKYGVVADDGFWIRSGVIPTPAGAGRAGLLGHLEETAAAAASLAKAVNVAPVALGVATAGWVDPQAGKVLYATENLPGWTGAPVAESLRGALTLPVAVENDANARAMAERYFGVAKRIDHFVCLTLGTGVGGGCYVGGRLNRGAHCFANAFGHLVVEPEGLPCHCGRHGCLETYANAAALLRYAEGRFTTPEALIRAAGDDAGARNAIRTYARYLAIGLTSIIHLFDPQLVVLAGGLIENNAALLSDLKGELAMRLLAAERRSLEVRFSELGYWGGVWGAAAVASEYLERQAHG